MTNMANLLKSEPDQFSKLNGEQLVRAKVRRLVAMAGRFPEGKEFNIEKDAASSVWIATHWPVDIIFTGWEIGAKLFSGLPLMRSPQINSPVKDVFAISIPKSEEDSKGRKSWDQTAVIIAVEGAEKFYSIVPGKMICNTDGSNAWLSSGRGHWYVKERVAAGEVEKIINDRMKHLPSQN